MGEFTVTSEVMKLDEFEENLVLENIQRILINVANKTEL